ncbi:MAG: 16S rRNA (cytosine(1402)-N(4))-methyltransferase RsmH [Candidatus Taylorbacteria bacterium]
MVNVMQTVHVPVLLNEIVEYLVNSNWIMVSSQSQPKNNNRLPIFLDCTLGGAGHALAIANALKGKICLVGVDRDENAIVRAKGLLEGKADKIILECGNFQDLVKILEKNDISEVDMILLDLGISSDELENSLRGFTFMKDEPLIMTMGDPERYLFTARDIVNNWKEEDIANVIYGYGEERFARRIARSILNYRAKKQIDTTLELVEIVKMSVPSFYRRGKTNPATKTFQALRIAVNDELNALKKGLESGYERLSSGGRMAVISFHSLEDRIVKDFYKEKQKTGAKILTKKPIIASDQERAENPRSRSAKLRVIEKP